MSDLETRVENALRFVEHPGNWSTLDGRAHAIADLLRGNLTTPDGQTLCVPVD